MRIVLSVKMRAWNKAEVYVEPDIAWEMANVGLISPRPS